VIYDQSRSKAHDSNRHCIDQQQRSGSGRLAITDGRDCRLRRDIAIKTSPESLSLDDGGRVPLPPAGSPPPRTTPTVVRKGYFLSYAYA
jgi:hypothetical protein